MGIEEFKKTLEVIENEWNNKSRAYTEQKYFIYIKNDLRSSYVEKTLRTRCMDNIRYIIVIGSYVSLEGYRNESLRTIGFFDNQYKLCEIHFDDWDLYDLDFDKFTGSLYSKYKPVPKIKRIGNPLDKKSFDELDYNIETFDEILAAIWKYIKEQ